MKKIKLTRLQAGKYYFHTYLKDGSNLRIWVEKSELTSGWIITSGKFGEENYWTDAFETLDQCRDCISREIYENNK